MPEAWLTESEFWQIIALLDWSKTGDDEAVIAPAVVSGFKSVPDENRKGLCARTIQPISMKLGLPERRRGYVITADLFSPPPNP